MSIIPWAPFLETVDNLEKGFANFAPAIDVYEEKDNVIVEATLAGIKAEDVEISVHEDVLTIEGKRHSASEVDEKNYYRKEVRSGAFYRSVMLPASVEADKAKAEFDNGMLKISMPKEKGNKSKSIKINIKK